MQLTCPHCQSTWDFADRRPAFCPFCGKSLSSEAPTQALAAPAVPASEDETQGCAPAAAGDGADPEVIGGYRLLRMLGVGGMGKVYEAEDLQSGRRVALKLVSADYAGSADAVERFRQEGRLASLIAHPRCVFVLAADEEAGRPYIVMELMPGDTLDDHIRHWGPLPAAQAVALILEVMEGLQAAHRVGVVHRDVKPSNCFFGRDGRLKVGDFGLAKALAPGAHLTKTGSFLGTPLYASPEQVRGEPLDAQTNVYSTAATLYFLLTGQAPFQSENAAVTLARIAADPAPPLRTLKPDLSPELDAVVLRGLERDRKRRWRNMDEFAAELRPFLRGQTTLAGLGVRFVALAIDLGVLWLLGLVLIAALHGVVRDNNAVLAEFGAPAVLGGFALWLLYFGVPEGLWGCSPGKWLFGLRIHDATVNRAAWGRIAARTVGFVGAVKLGTLVSAFVLLPWILHDTYIGRTGQVTLLSDERWLLVNLPRWGVLVGWCALALPMRRRNGYRGLHEILSGTRVVRPPRGRPPSSVRTPVPVPVLTRSAPIPQKSGRIGRVPDKIGPFEVRQVVRWDEGGKVLLGLDPALDRQVLLWLRPAGEPPLPDRRLEVNRAARLRCLSAGYYVDSRWEAFLAPDGGPLSAVIEAGGRLPWARFQPLLDQLTDELLESLKEDTLPAHLGPDQVWVRLDGGVVLLDFPLAEPTGPVPAGPNRADDDDTAVDRAFTLLARVSVSALEGRTPPDALPAFVRAPLPPWAATVLTSLLAFRRNELSLRRFQQRLHELQKSGPEVTRWRRAGQQAVLMVLVLLTYCCILALPGALLRSWARDRSEDQINQAENALLDLDSVAAPEDGGLRAQLQQARQSRTRRMTERAKWPSVYAYEYSALFHTNHQRSLGWRRTNVDPDFLRATVKNTANRLSGEDGINRAVLAADLAGSALGLLLWVGGALVLRRGWSFVVAGIDLVRPNGRPADRLRCAWRVFLVWLPFSVLLLASSWLDEWAWASWDGDGLAPVWLPALSLVQWCSAWGFLAAVALLAIRYPARSLDDYLAGTYLVPSR